ncbi:kinase-like protein [Gigaspora margarita]|uniref:Kinase-like protein n=1 Tax=Gigaspora margarita TaxID=4874 RepID=A0A8H3X9G9_GIGMA|nr:kinase-like protein [Gigaspora margarita]
MKISKHLKHLSINLLRIVVHSAYYEDIDQKITLKSLNHDLVEENTINEFLRENYYRSTSNALIGGTPRFSDPKYLKNPYEIERKVPSGIYSLGVLFWELSSGVPPFKNLGDTNVSRKVISGEREAPINGIPIDFTNLYCDAWNDDSNSHP